jgi:hypothetical protein
VRPFAVLCNRSPTPAMILSLHVMPHLPPAHHETSKHDSPMKQRIKVKQLKCPEFEFKPHQVNDSSQSNQGIDHLVSHSFLSCLHPSLSTFSSCPICHELINPLDGQHKESQCQHQRQCQQREQCCQPATPTDFGTSPINTSSNASDNATNNGQHVSRPRSSASAATSTS